MNYCWKSLLRIIGFTKRKRDPVPDMFCEIHPVVLYDQNRSNFSGNILLGYDRCLELVTIPALFLFCWDVRLFRKWLCFVLNWIQVGSSVAFFLFMWYLFMESLRFNKYELLFLVFSPSSGSFIRTHALYVSFYDVAKQQLLEMALWAAPPLIHTSHQTTTLPFIPPSLPLLSSHSLILPPSILCPLIWACGNMHTMGQRSEGHTPNQTKHTGISCFYERRVRWWILRKNV